MLADAANWKNWQKHIHGKLGQCVEAASQTRSGPTDTDFQDRNWSLSAADEGPCESYHD